MSPLLQETVKIRVDIAGVRDMRNMFEGVVNLQGVQLNLPINCTDLLDPTSCFFLQNLIAKIETPLFLLNSAYDYWQVSQSIAPKSADPHGDWTECNKKLENCSESQIQILQVFRDQMLNVVKGFLRVQKEWVIYIFMFCSLPIGEAGDLVCR